MGRYYCVALYAALCQGPLWASYKIHKIAECVCAGNTGNVFPHRRLQRKLLVSDPGMHHCTCVTLVPWCMSGSLTRSGGANVPSIPGACLSALWAHKFIRRNCFTEYARTWKDHPETPRQIKFMAIEGCQSFHDSYDSNVVYCIICSFGLFNNTQAYGPGTHHPASGSASDM